MSTVIAILLGPGSPFWFVPGAGIPSVPVVPELVLPLWIWGLSAALVSAALVILIARSVTGMKPLQRLREKVAHWSHRHPRRRPQHI